MRQTAPRFVLVPHQSVARTKCKIDSRHEPITLLEHSQNVRNLYTNTHDVTRIIGLDQRIKIGEPPNTRIIRHPPWASASGTSKLKGTMLGGAQLMRRKAVLRKNLHTKFRQTCITDTGQVRGKSGQASPKPMPSNSVGC